MKKLKLNKSNFAGGEVLTRAQLRKVMGGNLCVGENMDNHTICYNCCVYYMYKYEEEYPSDTGGGFDENYNPEIVCDSEC